MDYKIDMYEIPIGKTQVEAIKIIDVQELGDVMISQLSGLFENKKKLN